MVHVKGLLCSCMRVSAGFVDGEGNFVITGTSFVLRRRSEFLQIGCKQSMGR